MVRWRTGAQAAELLTSADPPRDPEWLKALREIGDEGITFAVDPAIPDGTWWLVERPEHLYSLLEHGDGVDPVCVWLRWYVAIVLGLETTIGSYSLPELAAALTHRFGPAPRVPVTGIAGEAGEGPSVT